MVKLVQKVISVENVLCLFNAEEKGKFYLNRTRNILFCMR